jgi:hypothetical protein
LIGHIAIVGRRALQAAALLLLAACATSNPTQPLSTTVGDEEQYEKLYPYYAEVCALSRLGKKPGFGAELTSGFGGHAVLYLQHVCRKKTETYPVLEMCDQAPGDRADGVGLSVNAHYESAAWVAVEGREFFFDGNLKAGRSLTREGYLALQAQARAKKIYDGVNFHEEVYESIPPTFTHAEGKYEVSVATDYAIGFGRNRYCARVPVSRPQMVKIVDYLNDLNKPYKDGEKIFDWNLLTHNCSHVNHNALAAADIWGEWEMDRFLLVSLFDFPVPKNEFVNLMQRTNDLPIDNLEAIFDDPEARMSLLRYGRLPTQPGAIADLGTIASPNEVYETQSRIIFYDDPITGRYEQRFDTMLNNPRYYRLQDNLAYFAALYKKIESERRPLDWYLQKRKATDGPEREAFRLFYDKYYDYIDRQVQEVAREIALLNNKTG